MPTGVESSMVSVMGKVGLFVSSKNSVVVKTPVIESAGLSLANAFLDRLKTPKSLDAVDDTIKMS